MAERLQVDDAVGHRRLGVAGGEHAHRDGDQSLPRGVELGGEFGGFAAGNSRGGHRLRDSRAEGNQAGSAPLGDLAAQQIQALDAVGALVDRVEPIVAIVLFDVVLAGVAVATHDLDRQTVGLQAPLRRPTLGDRGQDVQQQSGPVAFVVGVGAVLPVHQACAVQRQRQCAFGIGLLRQQHSLHIGMFDDRHLWR